MGKNNKAKWEEYESGLRAAQSETDQKEATIAERINNLDDKITRSAAVISGLKEEKYRYEIEGVIKKRTGEEDEKVSQNNFTTDINQETLTHDEWLQQKVTLMMETVQQRNMTPPDAGDDDEKAPGNSNGMLYFKSQKELEALTAAMEYAYAELGIPTITDKINYPNGSTHHVANLPEACRGIDIFSLNQAALNALREAIKEEMVAGETTFAKRYQEEIGDWVTSDDILNVENQDSSERKILGVFTQMLADRDNGVGTKVIGTDDKTSQSMINIEGESLDLAGIALGGLEDAELTPKQQGFKVTITLLKGKLEEIKAILAESGEEENQDDFKEQIEMLSNLIDEQHQKEIEEADKIINDALAQEEASQEQDHSERLIVEMMLQEKEMRDLAIFCEKNGIDMQVGKDGKAVLGEYTRGVLMEGQAISQGNSRG